MLVFKVALSRANVAAPPNKQ